MLDEFLTPEQVTSLVPGLTVNLLAQRRYKGLEPKYLKPSGKVILYRKEDILEWLNSSERAGTSDYAAAK